MKHLKQQALYLSLLLVCGVIMLLCTVVSGSSHIMMLSMGFVLVLACGIKLVRLCRLSRNPEAVRKLELAHTEERMVFISQKASKTTLFVVIELQYAAMLATIFLHRDEIATLLGFLVCAQLLLYVAFSRFYSKKY